MGSIQFEETRFDPDLVGLHGIAQQMARSVGCIAEMSVDGHIAKLLRLRVAQINACSCCLILHPKAVQGQGVDGAKVTHLHNWRKSTMFTDTEQAALAYCEGQTDYLLEGFGQLRAVLTKYFDTVQIAEIAAIIINLNVWTRLKLTQSAVPTVKV